MTPEEQAKAVAQISEAFARLARVARVFAEQFKAEVEQTLITLQPLLEGLADAPPDATETPEDPSTGVDTPEPTETKGEPS